MPVAYVAGRSSAVHFFFFQAEDGIRDYKVTGVQTCALPIYCAQARADARDPAIQCVEAVSANSAPGAEVNELAVLKPDVCITAFKHLHSAAVAPDLTHPLNPVVIVPDPGTLLLHPPGPGPSDGVTTAGNEGVSMFYQFRMDNFALAYHDTVGPLKENAPHVFEIMQALPPTDVQAGAIAGDRKSTRLNSSHLVISYAVFCLKKNKTPIVPI